MKHHAVVVVLASLILSVLPARATAGVPTPPTYWDIPEPLALNLDGPPDWSGVKWSRGHARYDAPHGPASEFKLRDFSWTGWGTARAVGRGRVHLCDADNCTRWRDGRIVLKRKRAGYCGDGTTPSQYNYRRYLLYGFHRVEPGTTFRAPAVC